MAGEGAKVEVRGIRELRGAFKQVSAELPKELREGLKGVATRIASAIRGKVTSVSGRAASSVKPRASQTGAGIAFGGSRAEYYPWLDFGGSVGRGHVKGKGGSGAIKRPFVKEGRWVYPTIREHRDDIEHEVDVLIGEVSRKAGFETRGESV